MRFRQPEKSAPSSHACGGGNPASAGVSAQALAAAPLDLAVFSSASVSKTGT